MVARHRIITPRAAKVEGTFLPGLLIKNVVRGDVAAAANPSLIDKDLRQVVVKRNREHKSFSGSHGHGAVKNRNSPDQIALLLDFIPRAKQHGITKTKRDSCRGRRLTIWPANRKLPAHKAVAIKFQLRT